MNDKTEKISVECQTLTDAHHVQNKLMWSRIQTLAVLEAGVVGAWYRIESKDQVFALALAAAGLLVSVLMFAVVLRDIRYFGWLRKSVEQCLSLGEEGTWILRGRTMLAGVAPVAVLGNVFLVVVSAMALAGFTQWQQPLGS